MEIAKKYDPTKVEDKWYSYWIENKLFHSEPDERKPYTIVIPPPNVTGILHMGHMLNNTIQDLLIRRKQAEGYNTCWVPGTDHASIATEAKVVKMLRSQGIKKHEIGREKFLEHAFEWKDKYGGIILKQLRKLGASCDWERTNFTMDGHYYQSVIKVFCDLYEKGLIYRGKRMVNWDPEAKTTVSDEEVIHKEVDGSLYYVKYPIKDSKDFITIATTRPETIMADTAIAVHPKDERYSHLIGKYAIVPLVNREVSIIADNYIDPEFGTGCLKVTPAHDVNDYEIGQRHNLEVIELLNEDGTLNEKARILVGIDRFEARKRIPKMLEEAGLLLKKEPHKHKVGFSERTDAAIEPRLSEQWFVRMKEISKEAYQAVEQDEVKLIPEKFKNTYRHWMENIRDWCISRQLWWGQRIPAYYLPDGQIVVAETVEEALAKARSLTGNSSLPPEALKQDEDVLDTWFSSWLWPIEVFRGFSDPGNADIEYYYPTSDLVTAPEILFFWVARMLMAGFLWQGKKPFNNVYLTGIVRDKLRRKMSKSLGNSPDPIELIHKYGADGIRVGLLLSSPAGNDLLFDESLCEQGRNFTNKIWNAFRLIRSWEAVEVGQTSVEKIAIEWMQARIRHASQQLEQQFEQFRISEAMMNLYKLAWDDFCSWFLEMLKPAEGKINATTLAQAKHLFEQILHLLHPFTPFITEEIWQHLETRSAGASIFLKQLPKPSDFSSAEEQLLQEMESIQAVITAGRKFRQEKQLPNKTAVTLQAKTETPALFKQYEHILAKFLHAQLEILEEAPEGAAGFRVGKHAFYIPLGGMIDIEAEKEKLKAEIQYLEGFLVSVNKKLSNENFVQRAPEQVVALERKKQQDAELKLAGLQKMLLGLF